MSRVGTLRTFGEWKLMLVDPASGEQAYVNCKTGETLEDPPDEVQAILIKESRAPLYDPTAYRFVDVRSCPRKESYQDPFVEFDSCPPVERVDLCCGGSDFAFLLRNLLSENECKDLIAQGEGFGLQDTGYSHRIRINDRVSVMGEDLGELLFERARPFLKDVVVPESGRVPKGVPRGLLKGTWQPTGLNPCFRCCKYSPGGFFSAHHDGGFAIGDTHKSIKTFMIYLNDGFEGGPTNFYTEDQPHYQPGLRQNVIHSLRPERGSCLVFNHNITHDGGELATGNKYILRTEVMYQHVSCFPDGSIRLHSDTAECSDSDFEAHDDQALPEAL